MTSLGSRPVTDGDRRSRRLGSEAGSGRRQARVAAHNRFCKVMLSGDRRRTNPGGSSGARVHVRLAESGFRGTVMNAM